MECPLVLGDHIEAFWSFLLVDLQECLKKCDDVISKIQLFHVINQYFCSQRMLHPQAPPLTPWQAPPLTPWQAPPLTPWQAPPLTPWQAPPLTPWQAPPLTPWQAPPLTPWQAPPLTSTHHHHHILAHQ